MDISSSISILLIKKNIKEFNKMNQYEVYHKFLVYKNLLFIRPRRKREYRSFYERNQR